jgi:hypothetical protein
MEWTCGLRASKHTGKRLNKLLSRSNKTMLEGIQRITADAAIIFSGTPTVCTSEASSRSESARGTSAAGRGHGLRRRTRISSGGDLNLL